MSWKNPGSWRLPQDPETHQARTSEHGHVDQRQPTTIDHTNKPRSTSTKMGRMRESVPPVHRR
jgi:hypothetical protein